MTRDEAKALLPIIQAYAEGKVIQIATKEGWKDLANPPCFTMAVDRYRIKPEPREWWINVYNNGDKTAYSAKDIADDCAGFRIDCIHVREVME